MIISTEGYAYDLIDNLEYTGEEQIALDNIFITKNPSKIYISII
jgi:hypothetical protein